MGRNKNYGGVIQAWSCSFFIKALLRPIIWASVIVTYLPLFHTVIATLPGIFLFGHRPFKKPVVNSFYCTAQFLVGQIAVNDCYSDRILNWSVQHCHEWMNWRNIYLTAIKIKAGPVTNSLRSIAVSLSTSAFRLPILCGVWFAILYLCFLFLHIYMNLDFHCLENLLCRVPCKNSSCCFHPGIGANILRWVHCKGYYTYVISNVWPSHFTSCDRSDRKIINCRSNSINLGSLLVMTVNRTIKTDLCIHLVLFHPHCSFEKSFTRPRHRSKLVPILLDVTRPFFCNFIGCFFIRLVPAFLEDLKTIHFPHWSLKSRRTIWAANANALLKKEKMVLAKMQWWKFLSQLWRGFAELRNHIH